jgi:hypothetical protein
MQPKITIVDGHKIRFAAFESEQLGHVSQKTIDLTPYAGQRVRIYLCEDGTYSLDQTTSQFWQVAELQVPEQEFEQVETGELDDQGNPIMQLNEIPLDLSSTEVLAWELPE